MENALEESGHGRPHCEWPHTPSIGSISIYLYIYIHIYIASQYQKLKTDTNLWVRFQNQEQGKN